MGTEAGRQSLDDTTTDDQLRARLLGYDDDPGFDRQCSPWSAATSGGDQDYKEKICTKAAAIMSTSKWTKHVVADADRIFHFSRFMTQGHSDAVTSVSSDVGAECIVTGSIDGTVRIWKFDREVTNAYLLHAVVKHNKRKPLDKVTAVSCSEDESIIISGTGCGDVFFTHMVHKDIHVKSALHTGAVTDICVRNAQVEEMTITVDYSTHHRGAEWSDEEHPLGVYFELDDQRRGLVITDFLDSGVIVDWNTEHPDQLIVRGDIITELNGMTLRISSKDDPDLVIKRELEKCHAEVRLHLWRSKQDEWLLATCGGTAAKVSVLRDGGEDALALNDCCTLQHTRNVNQVRFVGAAPWRSTLETGRWDGTLLHAVTASGDGARLWALNVEKGQAQELASFGPTDVGASNWGIAVPAHKEGFCFLAGGGVVTIWDMAHANDAGVLQPKQLTQLEDGKQLGYKTGIIAVSMDGDWAVDVRGHKCVQWDLAPKHHHQKHSHGEKLADIEGEGEGVAEETMLHLDHHDAVTTLCIVDDPEDGEVLITGAKNGEVVVWDLNGDDKGEKQAELSSVKIHEAIGPMIILVFQQCQVCAFALSPSVPWHRSAAHPAGIMVPLVMLDWQDALHLSPTHVFWLKQGGSIALMVAFVAIVFGDVQKRLTERMYRIHDSLDFRSEVQSDLADQKSKRRKNESKLLKRNRTQIAGPEQGKIRRIKRCLTLLNFFILASCTILVVPTSTTLAYGFVCERNETSVDLHQQQLLGDDAREVWVVQEAPEVLCGTSWHRTFTLAVFAVGPIFFYLLFAYGVVHGDHNYVQRSELFHPSTWTLNAVRKATVLHIGPLHPASQNHFFTICTDIAMKVSVSIIAKALLRRPRLRMVLLTACCTWMFVSTWLRPPYVQEATNTIRLGLRGGTLWMMVAGSLTEYIDDPTNILPVCMLLVGVVTVVLLTYRKVQEDLSHPDLPKFQTVRIATAEAHEIPSDPA